MQARKTPLFFHNRMAGKFCTKPYILQWWQYWNYIRTIVPMYLLHVPVGFAFFSPLFSYSTSCHPSFHNNNNKQPWLPHLPKHLIRRANHHPQQVHFLSLDLPLMMTIVVVMVVVSPFRHCHHHHHLLLLIIKMTHTIPIKRLLDSSPLRVFIQF